MAKKEKQHEGIEIIEDSYTIIDKINAFFDNKRNRIIVFGISGIILALAIGFPAYNYYITNQDKIAQEELFQAQFYFEKDSLRLALNGDGNSYGFIDVIEEFPGTKAASLSAFYAGVSYLKLGDFDGAVRYLKKFHSDDYLVQARAYSLIGDAYMEQDAFEQAATYYEQAVAYKPNPSFTPIYLKKLAIAQEQNGDLVAAAATYSVIEKKYPRSPQIHDDKKHRARLEALTQ